MLSTVQKLATIKNIFSLTFKNTHTDANVINIQMSPMLCPYLDSAIYQTLNDRLNKQYNVKMLI